MKLGPAGRFAALFINSKLTPLFIVASLILGAFAVVQLPREEEPQIKVPMADVFVPLPGASPREVEQRVTKPLERLLWEIPGVEYVYSTSGHGQALVIVRFKVGEDEERSIVKLEQKIFNHLDTIPQPLVKVRSIDDVPILALTLHSDRYGPLELRRIATEVADRLKEAVDVAGVEVIGGQRRELRVTLDPLRLAARGLDVLTVANALRAADRRVTAGALNDANREIVLEAGQFLRHARDAEQVVVAVANGRPVRVADIATVRDEGEEPAHYVTHVTREGAQAAVTIAVAKRKGANAITVAEAVLRKLDSAKQSLAGAQVTITRHYGETAAEKSNELLFHMAIAVFSVGLLVALTLGWRESGVVFAAIPVTLALTLAIFYFYGFTLNRITLFALIFSIGILVDDAIVVVENIVRHARLPENQGRALSEVAIEAVNEVGNPTILATLAVIGAILPMAFVGGLMGPYMLPIPIGASAAMVFSLLVAFLVTPWAAVRFLKPHGPGHDEGEEDVVTRFYRRWMARLLSSGRRTALFLAVIVSLLVAAMAFVPLQWVKVKMLPFDNKSEFQVIIDMPEGTSLEETQRVAMELAREAMKQPEAVHAQAYAGTAAPVNFNGLVRHYYLRRGAGMADIQLALLGKDERQLQSHEIAKQVRERLAPLARRLGARIKVAEVPPGPPVIQTLVAEIYGPTQAGQHKLAAEILRTFERTPGVVDADWYVDEPQPRRRFEVDAEKAALHGVSVEQVAATLRLAAQGETAARLHLPAEQEEVPVRVTLPREARGRLDELRVRGVPLREVTRVVEDQREPAIYHKNLMPVTYVTADIAGVVESPVYAILQLGSQIKVEQYVAQLPPNSEIYTMKWDGEWHITYEVFRDLGLAFAAVLVLIYVLVVGWFESFLTPLVIMAAIPFSLVGILPGHAAMNAFFTATSMIGFIAGAGIVVRNSIILVDFIELRWKQGMPLMEAVVDAGAVRFRPMMLTAAAVVVGSAVILFDPIFQGLAIALMAGEIASLLLSRVTVPVLYYILNRRREQP